MQSFPAPNQKLKFNHVALTSLILKDYLFNSFPIHAIYVLIPGSEKLVEGCEEVLTSSDSTYFIVKQISTTSLIQKAFIDNFVKKGSLCAFSSGVKAETENFLTLISPGKLILSLEKEIADSLSLIKEKPNHLKKKARLSHQVYNIEVSSKDFIPGKKLYDSTSYELDKLKHIEFELLVKWEPEGNICSESIRSYFECQGFECISCEPQHTHHSNLTVPMPKIEASLFDPSLAEDMLEWIGTQICGIEYTDTSDKYVSNFNVPDPSETLHKLQVCSFKGFYVGVQVINLLKQIRKMFEADKNLPFVSILVSGYQDCYISSKTLQKFSSADKLICIVIFPNLDCWSITLNT